MKKTSHGIDRVTQRKQTRAMAIKIITTYQPILKNRAAAILSANNGWKLATNRDIIDEILFSGEISEDKDNFLKISEEINKKLNQEEVAILTAKPLTEAEEKEEDEEE